MSKQLSFDTIANLKRATKHFPTFLIFCTSQFNGGFCYGQGQTKEDNDRLGAQIYDTLVHQPDLRKTLKDIIERIEKKPN